jgi:hypothetical protein
VSVLHVRDGQMKQVIICDRGKGSEQRGPLNAMRAVLAMGPGRSGCVRFHEALEHEPQALFRARSKNEGGQTTQAGGFDTGPIGAACVAACGDVSIA